MPRPFLIKNVPDHTIIEFAQSAKVAGVTQGELLEILTVYAMERWNVLTEMQRRKEVKR